MIMKLHFARQATRIADIAARVLGPALAADTGEWGTFAWTRWVSGAPGLRIAGGTDEIQRNVLAERVLGLPRSTT
jgi:acyl-CoA dehydrogenase